MRRGNVSSIASLLDGFSSTYDTIGKVMKDKDLKEIADAKPEETLGAQQAGTAEDIQKLQDDGASGPEAARLASGPRAASTYSLLGQTQATPFTPDQAANARQSAQAGVLEKHGDLEGAGRIRQRAQQGILTDLQISGTKAQQARDVTRDARDTQRFEYEKSREEQAARDRAREEEYKQGAQRLFTESEFGKKHSAYATAMDGYQKAQAEYKSKVDAGDTAAVAPIAPAQPTMLPSDMILDAATMLKHSAAYGKATPEQFLHVADKMKQVQEEGYVQALRLAQPSPGQKSGAPLTAVIEAFNKQGNVKIDPSAVIEDKLVDRGGGVQSRLITFKTPNGATQTIDTYAGLQQFGKANEVFTQAMQLHSAQVADKQVAISGGQLDVARQGLKLHQQQYNDTLPERNAKDAEADLRLRLADTEDPAEQAKLSAKISALRTGVRGAGSALDPAHVKEAKALVAASNGALDEQTALENAMHKPEQLRKSYFEAAMKVDMNGDKAADTADKMMQRDGWVKKGSYWGRASSKPAGTFESMAEAEAAVKAGKLKAGDKVTIGGRSATWQ